MLPTSPLRQLSLLSAFAEMRTMMLMSMEARARTPAFYFTTVLAKRTKIRVGNAVHDGEAPVRREAALPTHLLIWGFGTPRGVQMGRRCESVAVPPL
jgi:hypothetical protein